MSNIDQAEANHFRRAFNQTCYNGANWTDLLSHNSSSNTNLSTTYDVFRSQHNSQTFRLNEVHLTINCRCGSVQSYAKFRQVQRVHLLVYCTKSVHSVTNKIKMAPKIRFF